MTAYTEAAARFPWASVVPIGPGTKAPGFWSGAAWSRMLSWQQYCSRLPNDAERDAWATWPDAGAGIALGAASNMAAVDIDTTVSTVEFWAIVNSLPPTPLSKRGKKGLTLFYRHNPAVQSHNLHGVCDILCAGRQTVIPPSIHPETGQPYEWQGSGYIDSPDDLPMLPSDVLARVCAAAGIQPPKARAPIPTDAPGGDESHGINRAQLARALANEIPGKIKGRELIGNAPYRPGSDSGSFAMNLDTGAWNDIAHGQKGDVFDLLGRLRKIDPVTDFPRLIDEARRMVGAPSPSRYAIEIPAAPIPAVPDTAEPQTAPAVVLDINAMHPWVGQIAGAKRACEDRPPTRFLLQNIIPASRIGIISGAPGSLKSMVVMDLALCVASGRPWMGNNTNPTRTIWWNADSPSDVMLDRYGAFVRGGGYPDEIPMGILSFPAPRLDLFSPASVGFLSSFIDATGAGLIVVDALQRAKGDADENKSSDMGRVMEHARGVVERTGASILFIHHVGKEMTGKQVAYRGSSAIMDAADFAIISERKDKLVTFKATKERECEIPQTQCEWWYEHKPGTNQLHRCGFREPVGATIAAAHQDVERQIIAAIAGYEGEIGPGVGELREACRPARNPAVDAAIGGLLARGEIQITTGPRGKKHHILGANVGAGQMGGADNE